MVDFSLKVKLIKFANILFRINIDIEKNETGV